MKKKTLAKRVSDFAYLLTILFIVLKIAKVISFSWIWVLSPIWLTLTICLLVIGIVVVWESVESSKRA